MVSITTHRVGLDVNRQIVKLAVLEPAAGGWRLSRHQCYRLPTEGAPADQAAATAAALTTALQDCATREAHLAVSHPDVVITRLTAPPMPAAELPEAVKWQLKEQLAFPVQEAVVAVRRDEGEEVLAAAATQAVVRDALALSERAGLRAISVTPAPLAIWTAIQHLVPSASDGTTALVDVEDDTTYVAVLQAGRVRLVRGLGVSMTTVTESLIGVVASDAGTVSIDRALAEALHGQYGIPPDGATEITASGVPLGYVASAIRPVLEQLATEIGRVLNYCRIELGLAPPARLWLCGDGAMLKGLDAFLTAAVGVPVEVFHPFAEQAGADAPRLAAAIGAALAGAQDINLLPADVRRAREATALGRLIRHVARCVAVAGITILLGLGGVLGVLQWRLSGRQDAWAKQEQTYSRQQMLAPLVHFVARQPVWEAVFKELAAATPPEIKLRDVVIDGGQPGAPMALSLSVKGRVKTDAAAVQSVLSQFVEQLERSACFAQVRLAQAAAEGADPSAVGFEITGVLE